MKLLPRAFSLVSRYTHQCQYPAFNGAGAVWHSFSTQIPKSAKFGGSSDRKIRKFYEAVTVEKVDGGWSIFLDKRPLMTPGGNKFAIPSQKSAMLIASEWEVQSNFIKFELMPLSALSIQTLDLISHGDTRLQVEAETLKFLQTDCVLFRSPEKQQSELIEVQKSIIDPMLKSIEINYNLPSALAISYSLSPPSQTSGSRDILASIIRRKNEWELSCFFCIVRNLKSYLLGVALTDGLISTREACRASSTEEDYQQKKWGLVEGSHDVDRACVEMWLNAALLLQKSIQYTPEK